MAESTTNQLYAIVDMGSNGIRFSITDLSPPTVRSLPTVYQSRLGVSLYDAQYTNGPSGERGPIPQHTISEILSALQRFRQTSLDFDVPQKSENVRIIATEATRTAINAKEFIESIETTLGEPWKVELLKKEDEGRIGALGVVSSVGGSNGLEGLVMDLGGGSTQITWAIAHPGEELQTSEVAAMSFPYGAAAMTRLLADIDSSKNPDEERTKLRKKMVSQFQDAIVQLKMPSSLQKKADSRGITLYLSGGGFRGWGYLLMSSHRIRPYPLPIINGFSVPVKDFKDTLHVSGLAEENMAEKIKDGVGVFRVSKRRAAQVPAVSFLVDALIEAIPIVANVRFCQGGVREGWLFDTLPMDVRSTDPLVGASARFVIDEQSARHFTELLASALPPDCTKLDRRASASLKDSVLLQAFANCLFIQRGHSKESAAVNALHVPITGVLASTHGVGHTERALLSLMLCQRWGGEGDLPAPHGETKNRLELLLTQQEVWWSRYLGIVGTCIGDVYPSGRVREGDQRMKISSRWAEGLGKKGNMQGIVVKLEVANVLGKDAVNDMAETLEKLGKKKNRVGGREYGFGVPVSVEIVRSSAT